MSIPHLQELSEQILKSTDGNQIQTEIALISLESLRNMMLSDAQAKTLDEQTTVGQGQGTQGSAEPGQAITNANANQFFFDEPITPTVIGPNYSSDIMMQAQNIPFLYHQPQEKY